ncbi:pentapeptide repeat-containing protein [Winogradskya humida]|uniref:Pentapeptide repeat protein n=1 Tax=Winogradskya humida TaxID=113566 RepID=A0ABQ4A5G8_9ACTN|nr:pentapeptide repeat-containing protein [Actinoplanes humidus]GIE26088.1 hypothetical protein Ahu01nite_091900 [Actinoplanes humidus]
MPTRRTRPASRTAPVRRTEPKAPVLPSALKEAPLPEHELTPEAQFQELAFYDVDLTDSMAEQVEFTQCRFRGARMAESKLPGVRLADCVVEQSDWSNLRAEQGTMTRVSLAGSRMTGLAWNGGMLRDVAVDDCKLDLTNWRASRFDGVFVNGSNLTGADFTDADLRGATFTGCDLSGAQFSNAKMEGARFRRCELAGIGGVTSWRGVVVHPEDLMGLSHVLAKALGIVVEQAP